MEIQAAGEGRFLDGLYRKVYAVFVKPLLGLYLKRDTTARMGPYRLKVFKGVFHPKLFFSTRYFYEFVSELDLKGRSVLEIGCGSGVISMLALQKGAKVTAIDIDPLAVKNTQINIKKNFSDLSKIAVVQSDLFENIQGNRFDTVLINPPYYFKDAQHPSEIAWYCGKEGEYFVRLFSELPRTLNPGCEIFMILEENCEIERIKSIALNGGFLFEQISEKKIRWENNYIFSIQLRG